MLVTKDRKKKKGWFDLVLLLSATTLQLGPRPNDLRIGPVLVRAHARCQQTCQRRASSERASAGGRLVRVRRTPTTEAQRSPRPDPGTGGAGTPHATRRRAAPSPRRIWPAPKFRFASDSAGRRRWEPVESEGQGRRFRYAYASAGIGGEVVMASPTKRRPKGTIFLASIPSAFGGTSLLFPPPGRRKRRWEGWKPPPSAPTGRPPPAELVEAAGAGPHDRQNRRAGRELAGWPTGRATATHHFGTSSHALNIFVSRYRPNKMGRVIIQLSQLEVVVGDYLCLLERVFLPVRAWDNWLLLLLASSTRKLKRTCMCWV